jgi:NAD(P)-dependent dehydrogenase (short-subunit alcohol dehydrogenase family)
MMMGRADRPYSGMVAVVTGAGRGLGAGLAEGFAAEGMILGLCSRTRPEVPAGAVGLARSVEVTDAAAVERFAAEVVEAFGRIDLWINNAGVLIPIGPLADADPSAVRANVEVNVLGVAYGTRSFARHVRTRAGGGVLVNVSSGAAVKPYEGWAAYCASKAAVEMLTEVVAREERDWGLRAFALAPGAVDTDMQAVIRATSEEQFPSVERFRRMHAAGELNTPDDVARFVLDELLDGGTDGGTDGQSELQVRRRVPDKA